MFFLSQQFSNKGSCRLGAGASYIPEISQSNLTVRMSLLVKETSAELEDQGNKWPSLMLTTAPSSSVFCIAMKSGKFSPNLDRRTVPGRLTKKIKGSNFYDLSNRTMQWHSQCSVTAVLHLWIHGQKPLHALSQHGIRQLNRA